MASREIQAALDDVSTITYMPVKIRGRHRQGCDDRWWRMTGGFEQADERGRVAMEDAMPLKMRWFCIRCDGCGADGLARAIWLDYLINGSQRGFAT
jgi:hypothetical protein